MKLIVAKLKKDNPYHGVDQYDARKELILLQVKGSAALDTHITQLTTYGASIAERAAAYTAAEEVYQVLVHGNLGLDATAHRNSYFLPEELTILDKQVETTQMQLVMKVRGMQNALYLGTITNVGNIYPVIKLASWQRGNYLVIENTAFELVPSGYFQVPDPNFIRPEVVVAKIKATALGIKSTDSVILKVLKIDGNLQILDGPNEGTTLRTDTVTLPTEQELPIWERKITQRRQVVLHEQLTSTITSLAGDEVGSYFYKATNAYEVSRAYYNYYLLTYNGPDYLMVDPADYKKVSYVPFNKVAGVLEKGQDPWTVAGRVSVTWAKLVSNLFLEGFFTARQLEVFHNAATAMVTQEFGPEDLKPELLIVHGADIATYYSDRKYVLPKAGELWSSCMRHVPSAYFGLYVENPDKVGLLISRERETGNIHGRALVWNHDGKQYLDRVYATTVIEQVRMQKWATDQGMDDIWNNRSRRQELRLEIPLAMPYQSHYPYMDSMMCLDVDNGVICNYYKDGSVGMTETGGGRQHKNGETACAVTGRYAPKTKMVQTLSKKHALKDFVKQLRSGAYEATENTLEDELLGGIIAKSQMVRVHMPETTPLGVVSDKMVATSQSNPDICFVAGKARHYPATDCAYSKLDKAFILKSDSELMPDGSYCSPTNAERYKAALARRMPNAALGAIEKPAPVLEAVLA